MASITNPRIYRPQPATLKIQQHVATPFWTAVSKHTFKQICAILIASIVFHLAANHILETNQNQKNVQIQHLQTSYYQAGDENITLLTTRAKLMSRTHVQEIAKSKFGLFSPEKTQVHRF